MPKTRRRPEQWFEVQRAADRHQPRFVKPFLRSVEALRDRLSLEDIEESAVAGTMSRRLAEAIDQVQIAKQDPFDDATRVYASVIADSVAGQSEWVTSRFGDAGTAIIGRLDIVSPFVLRAARTLTGNMIRQVSGETKMAIRRLIFDGIRDGIPPRETARAIRQIVGLTSRQALAVDRFRKTVFESTDDILRAELQAGNMAQRMLRDRAENIARTETMLASNRGQQLLWEQMRDEGIVNPEMGQRWMVTPDDRLCPRCAPMSGKVVQLGFLFRETQRGVLPSQRVPVAGATVESPPLHPRCRCVVVFDG